MNSRKLAVVSAMALALVLGVMIFGGRTTRASGPICTVGPAGDYTTIQDAVNDPACTTINVAPGTYNEQVQISRPLTLNGAQHGIDARTRVPTSESIINNSCGPVQIFADSVVLDGFTIQGSTDLDPCYVAGIYTNPGSHNSDVGGYQILNNIIQNNIIGIEMDNTGALQAKVQQNLIQNNNANDIGPDNGTGIDTNFGLNNAVIDSNKFVGHIGSGIDAVNAGGSNITYSNNEFDSNRRAIGLFNVTSSIITGNNIHNSTSPDNTADIRIFGGVSNLSITCNILANGAGRAIRINDAGFLLVPDPNSSIAINNNNISGYPTGLEENLGGYTGGFNSLDATHNWWGSSTGPTIASNPGGSGELIIDEDGVVKYSPFLTSPSTCVPVIDQCPNDPNKTAPGQCGCGVPDTDTDGDGTADCNDLCPNDPNKIAPGVCGCGHPDTDTDHDGTLDCNDLCPNDPNKTAPGLCGCGVPDIPGCTTTLVTMGPQAMEGDLKVHPGDILKVGYDFTMPGSHAAAMVSFLNSMVTFQYTCVSGPGSGSFAVSMPNQTYPVPQNNSNWFPSGDQESPSVFQRSMPVPNVCGGGLVRLQKGGTFTTLLGSDDKTDKVNIRWHYSANGSAGGWSGTQSVVPR